MNKVYKIGLGLFFIASFKPNHLELQKLTKIWKILLNLYVRGIADDVGFMNNTSVFNHFYVLCFPRVKSSERTEREKYTKVYVNLIPMVRTCFHRLEPSGIFCMKFPILSLLFIMAEETKSR